MMLYIFPGLLWVVSANKSSLDRQDNLEVTSTEVVCLTGAPTVFSKIVSYKDLLQKRWNDSY